MFSPDRYHESVLSSKKILSFDKEKPFAEQQKAIKEKLREVLGDTPEMVPLNPRVEETIEHETYVERRIVFDVEKDVEAVCTFCIPKNVKGKIPLSIVLQGHGTGMHISLGKKIYEKDSSAGDRDMALHALERGFAALCLEQRGMGERRTMKVWNTDDKGAPRCTTTAMNALLAGRTILGERCWDVSRAIDLALTYDEIDPDRIICTGQSGGGTATFYAACMDERITVAMPCCGICTYKDSIGKVPHCVCNFVPNIAKYMDMGDMAAAIAPRKLIVIHGKEDYIFPDEGVKEIFATMQDIYAAAGAPDNCALATGAEGHRYYKAEAYEQFDRIVGWKE